MKKRGTFEIIECIYNCLKDEKELSIKKISTKVNTSWETANKWLNLLVKINVVKERK